MKHRRNDLIQLLVLLTLGAAVILTLVLPQMSAGRRPPQPLEVSVLIREPDSALWANARLGMEQAAGELGAELRFLTLSAANDGGEQEELLLRESERGADALVVAPAQTQELSGRLGELTGQHPVVCLESPLEGAALTVAPDNRPLGGDLARAVLEDWTGGAVLLLDTAPGSAGVAARLEEARRVLEQAGARVETAALPAGELGVRLDALLRDSGAQQVVAFEPSATERAAEAKESGGFSQLLYGVGVTANIAAWLERGTVSAVAAWSDYAAGYLAVEGAILAARGEENPAKLLDLTVLRGEDIYEPDNQKLLFPVTS